MNEAGWWRWLAFLLLFIVPFLAQAEVAIPPLQARVTDLTGTLNASQQAQLEQALSDLETRKGSQIAVLIVPGTKPESVEQYGLRVAEQWKLGRKGTDDGALLLVAKEDRALRIEVGYGLEGVIPDAVAKRVISEIIVPYFKQGDYFGGIHAGVSRLIRLVDGEALPPPQQKDVSWAGIDAYLPFGLIAVFLVGGVLRALFGRFPGALLAGGVAAVVFWLIVGSLLGALVVWLVVFIFLLGGGGRGPGGFGGWSSGSGGSMGGGGFSGGGGGFGGGGASGNWREVVDDQGEIAGVMLRSKTVMERQA